MIWYVLASLVALLLLLLTVPLTLSVRINEQGEKVLFGRIFGICVYRSPKKRKKVRLSDYSPRALRRRERKARRALAKSQKKQDIRTRKPTEQKKDVPLLEQISSVADLASRILRRSLHHARVTVDSLCITVATPDAARTAVLYGAVCSALSLLTEALHSFSHLRIRDPKKYGVAVDFTSEKMRADIRLHFSLRVHHVIRIAWHTLMALMRREMKKQKRH